MISPELEQAVRIAGDLPTIPVIATRVMQLIEDENTTVEELAKVVASDPAVAARVLKISNSAFYGCQRQIQTLSSAILMLGFNTLRSLVIAASVKQVYNPFGLIEKMLWDHSFGAGVAAKIIASKSRLVNEEEAFLGGMFHDIGKIILNTLDRDKFQRVMQICYNEGVSFEEAEDSVYSFTHSEIGAYVIKKWNFPAMLTNVVMNHHSLEFSPEAEKIEKNLTAIVNLADQFCKQLGIGVRDPMEDIEPAKSKAAEIAGLSEERLNELLDIFKEAFNRDQSFFS